MKTFSTVWLAAILIFIIAVLNPSCQKDISKQHNDQQLLKIYLTDDPVPYNAVYVDIQLIEVKVSPDSCRSKDDDGEDEHDGDDDHEDGSDDHDNDADGQSCARWDTLNIRPGVYNLLSLSNGTDTLLASGYTPAGRILKLRITLGNNNSVVIDSVSYPLNLYNGNHQVIVSVKHDDDVEETRPGNLQMFLDFDASRSIIRIDNNHFVLRPWIGLFLPSRTAAIEGRITPGQARPIIAAYANGDTLVAIPHDDGEFKIRGLKGSSANLFINATANGYRDTTINNIHISAGNETDIGTIHLHQ